VYEDIPYKNRAFPPGKAPSDEAYMTFLLGLGAQGNTRTKTLKAFTKEELGEMIKKLP